MTDQEVETFSANLYRLRQSIAGADPLAPVDDAAFAEAAGVERHFAQAEPAVRGRLLLRALDDAISAFEVAAQLAEREHGAAESANARGDLPEALRDAYLAFRDGQPAFQSLYHYRNALAASLHPEAPDASAAREKPARKRTRKGAGKSEA